MNRCDRCKFFYDVGGQPAGECRYSPPPVIGVTQAGTPMSAFPPVRIDHWCGKWEQGKLVRPATVVPAMV